jgi:hypothetical protein
MLQWHRHSIKYLQKARTSILRDATDVKEAMHVATSLATALLGCPRVWARLFLRNRIQIAIKAESSSCALIVLVLLVLLKFFFGELTIELDVDTFGQLDAESMQQLNGHEGGQLRVNACSLSKEKRPHLRINVFTLSGSDTGYDLQDATSGAVLVFLERSDKAWNGLRSAASRNFQWWIQKHARALDTLTLQRAEVPQVEDEGRKCCPCKDATPRDIYSKVPYTTTKIWYPECAAQRTALNRLREECVFDYDTDKYPFLEYMRELLGINTQEPPAGSGDGCGDGEGGDGEGGDGAGEHDRPETDDDLARLHCTEGLLRLPRGARGKGQHPKGGQAEGDEPPAGAGSGASSKDPPRIYLIRTGRSGVRARLNLSRWNDRSRNPAKARFDALFHRFIRDFIATGPRTRQARSDAEDDAEDDAKDDKEDDAKDDEEEVSRKEGNGAAGGEANTSEDEAEPVVFPAVNVEAFDGSTAAFDSPVANTDAAQSEVQSNVQGSAQSNSVLDGPLVYQQRPMFRVSVPFDEPMGTPHADSDYHHPPWEINWWLPLTRSFG